MSRKTGATAKLEQVAHRMWLDGMTDPQIAEVVGCSKVTVYNWRYKLGLEANGGHGTPQRTMSYKTRLASQRATADCWERWLTDREAADELGISQPAYTQRRIRLGLPNRRKVKLARIRAGKIGWNKLTAEEKKNKINKIHCARKQKAEARRKVGME